MGSFFSSLGSGTPSLGGSSIGSSGSSPFKFGSGLSMPGLPTSGGSGSGLGSLFPGLGGGGSGGSGISSLFPGLGGGGSGGSGGSGISSLFPGLGGGSGDGGIGSLFPGLGGGTGGSGLGSFFPGMGGGSSQDSGACTDFHLVFARGTTEPQGLGMLGQPLAAGLKSKLSSVSSYAVVYPAGIMQNSASGSRDAETHIKTYLSKCPQSKIIIGGYSQGASLVHGIKGSEFSQAVCSVVLYGDPYLQFGPIVSSGNRGLPINDQSGVFNACNNGDFICGKANQLGTGISHLGYYPGVTQASVAFAADACKRAAGSNTTIKNKRSEQDLAMSNRDFLRDSEETRSAETSGHKKMRASASMTQNEVFDVLDSLFIYATIHDQHAANRARSIKVA